MVDGQFGYYARMLGLQLAIFHGGCATASDDSGGEELRLEVASSACDRIVECSPAGEIPSKESCVADYASGLEDESDDCVRAIRDEIDCLADLECQAQDTSSCTAKMNVADQRCSS